MKKNISCGSINMCKIEKEYQFGLYKYLNQYHYNDQTNQTTYFATTNLTILSQLNIEANNVAPPFKTIELQSLILEINPFLPHNLQGFSVSDEGKIVNQKVPMDIVAKRERFPENAQECGSFLKSFCEKNADQLNNGFLLNIGNSNIISLINIRILPGDKPIIEMTLELLTHIFQKVGLDCA